MRRNLTNSFRGLLRTFAHTFDTYRPELHYMRGPGPKWHAKRSAAAVSAASACVKGVPTLTEIAKVHA
jgi:hypothetical protein